MSMTTFTPTSSDVVHRTLVDFVLRPVQNVIHIVQYDSGLPIIEVSLYRNGEEYQLPVDAKIWLSWGTKGHMYTRKLAMVSTDRTKIYFRVTYNMAYFEGNINPILVLEFADGKCGGSSIIPVTIDHSPIQYADGPAAPEDEILEEIKNLSNGIPIEIDIGTISSSGDLYLNLFNTLTTYILENDLVVSLFAKSLGDGDYEARSSVMRVCYTTNDYHKHSDIIVISAYNLTGDVGFTCSVEFICSRAGIKTDPITYEDGPSYPGGHFDTVTGYEEIYGGGGTVDLPLARGSATNSLKQTAATASGVNSSAFGTSTASGERAHAEGNACVASGNQSHAEGSQSQATANQAHAEGFGCHATGNGAHAENDECIAAGPYSHAEGESCQTTVVGKYGHAGGNATIVSNEGAFAHGMGLVTGMNYQFVVGKYNESSSDSLFIVGYGTANGSRKNAFRVTTTGGCVGYYFVTQKYTDINSGNNALVNLEWLNYTIRSLETLASLNNMYLIRFIYNSTGPGGNGINGGNNNIQFSLDDGVIWYNINKLDSDRIGYYVGVSSTIKFRIKNGSNSGSSSIYIYKNPGSSSSNRLDSISSNTTEYVVGNAINVSDGKIGPNNNVRDFYIDFAFYY